LILLVAAPILQGIILGLGICGTLGPQSLFVLRQGIQREAAFSVAMVCILTDLLFIAAAVAGADAIVMLFPEAVSFGIWGGAIFTLVFGCLALLAALQPRTGQITGTFPARTTTTAFALCLLNPQVYFEMVALVGGAALQFAPAERIVFAVGVGLVSPFWFFGLAAGGWRLSYYFSRPRSQAAFDLVTGLAMVGLATIMIINQLSP
jgi:L-lysine exporter family protein LysE/ArgO